MKDFLPLFPLKLVAYPGERLNLHIFEPRYRQLIRECEQNSITFGIPTFIENKVMDFGTEMKLVSVEKKYESGEMDIKTLGVGIFKIHEFYKVAPNKLYSGADIQRLDIDTSSDFLKSQAILKGLEELFRILKINKEVPKEPDQFQTYDIAHHVGFSLEQEYEFLCIPKERDRQEYMEAHIQRLIPVVKEMERLRKRAEMNGHFKNVIPPNP